MSILENQFVTVLKKKLNKIPERSAAAVLEMHKAGNTVPFMARYRKEKTGNLDEVQIRDVLELYEDFQELNSRRDFILKEVEKQGNLTDQLKQRIVASDNMSELEELYRPFKRKKKTKATLAREAGLGPLADWIWGIGDESLKDSTTLEVKAKDFIKPASGYPTYEEVLRGTQHIVVEKINNLPELRVFVKDEYSKHGKIVCKKTTKFKTNSKFDMYGDFSEEVKSLMTKKASHRYLALRRGWQEEELKVSVEANDGKLLETFERQVCKSSNQAEKFLKECAKTSLTVHVIPSIVNELHRHLKESAEEYSILVFAENVRKILMSSPYGQKVILGVDPGLKSGCKLALIDQNGNFVSHTVLHILGEKAQENSKKLFGEVSKQVQIGGIAVGNGTGGREAQKFITDIIKELELETPVIMVNESGASVYSASEVARNEFPDLDITVRGAISIARRLQDPLAELVKIEPKSIGVGQYQHDLNQSKLKKTLHAVVESCVNNVGVNLNTASSSLLQYVAGIGPAIATNVIQYRKEHGNFKERQQLLKVPQFNTKAFEQAAGFLRIYEGSLALDQTGIHPERYPMIREMAKELKVEVRELFADGANKLSDLREKWEKLIGEFTFSDIIRELKQPGIDPRDPFEHFSFREDITKVDDLKSDMICPGIVTNVTNFGAFVDIGVHQDGLVHISHISNKFIEDPRKEVNPGDQVKVKILSVDKEKKQIGLSMLLEGKQSPAKRSVRKAKPKGTFKGKAKGRSAKPHRKGGGKPGNKGPARKPFNNPFAALTDLKK